MLDKPNKIKPETWLELLKWLIGTVGIGVITICVNGEIQRAEIAIKRLEADAGFVEVVLEHNGDTSELQYLQRIRPFITTPDIKDEVDNRIEALSISVDLGGKARAEEVSASKGRKVFEDASSDVKVKFEKERDDQKAESKVPQEQRKLEDLVAKENSIVPGGSSIGGESIAALSEIKNMTTPIEIKSDKETYILVGSPVTKWCKKNYYVVFNNALRLGINDISKSTGSIEFNLMEVVNGDSENAVPLSNHTNEQLNEGEKSSVIVGDYRYEISLDYIGPAGKNPLTPAAYITVSAYALQK